QKAYEALLAYAQQHQLPVLASMTLNRLAILAAQQSFDKPPVRALLEEAWRIAERSHDKKALAEMAWNEAEIASIMCEDRTHALAHGQQALSLARGIQDRELEARCLSSLGLIHLLGGDFEEAIHCLEAALALYAALSNEPLASRELSLPSFGIGAPPTQPVTNRASEAACWGVLAAAQVQVGQVHNSLRNGRWALALAQESKNDWVQVSSSFSLAYGLLEVGAYEEALVLMQDAVPLARTLPQGVILQSFLTAL